MTRLYSDFIADRLTEYFEKYGWSVLRGAILDELLNEAFKEGQLSVVNTPMQKQEGQ